MKKAIIYVRGNKEKMQEIICRLYASEKGYKILYATTNMDDVNLCDVLLISNPSRISRNHVEYEEIVLKLKKRGIQVESVANQDNDFESMSLTMDLMK